MARNVPRVKVDPPPKMNEYLGLRKSTITRVYTVFTDNVNEKKILKKCVVPFKLFYIFQCIHGPRFEQQLHP